MQKIFRDSSIKQSKKQVDEEFIATPEFDGPCKNRDCTDIFFLLLLLAAWTAMTLIGLAAVGAIDSSVINQGNPQRLIRGVDYEGNICGVDDIVKHLGEKWEPKVPTDDGTIVGFELGICVDTCPDAGEKRYDPYGKYGSWTAILKTTDVLNYCIPIDTTRASSFARDTFGDFIRAAGPIAISGFVISLVISYLYLYLMRVPPILHILVWGTIAIVQGILVIAAIFLLNKANNKNDSVGENANSYSETQVKLLYAFGGTLAVLSFLWFCTVLFLRYRIILAIGLIQEAAAAITGIAILPFFCLFQLLGIVAFSVIWLVWAIYLVSSAEVVTHEDDIADASYKTYHYDEESKKAILFLMFVWLWTVAFIHGIGQITCAHAVLRWYFASEKDKPGSFQLVRSFGVIVRYHSGTAAFGGLILAVVQSIRAFILYLQMKFGQRQDWLARYILKCLSCCFWCLEECLKFITKHAYIQCALEGKGFLASAMRAFGLILRNLGRVAMVTMVGNMVVTVGKFAVTIVCAALAYLYMNKYLQHDLTGMTLPTIYVAFIAYFTSSIFLETIGTTADTLLQGFLVEEEMQRMFRKGKGSSRKLTHQPSMKQYMEKQKSGLPKERGGIKDGKPRRAQGLQVDRAEDESKL